MKRTLIFVMIVLGISIISYAEEGVKLFEDELGEYALNVSGDAKFVLKNQENYRSPFDIPMWGWGDRAGASNRDSQFMRMQGNLNFYMGKPGMSEWFGVTSLWYDVNSPDNMDPELGNKNKEEDELEITNAFLMWRPFLVKDEYGEAKGRPFGISVGQQTIKATANAAYSNIFTGDLDGDFIAYSISILQNKPMVNFDFHLSDKTGIGYAFVKGSSDIIQNSAAFSDDYSRTHVFYGEHAVKGMQFNGALQITEGNRGETKLVQNDYSSYKELDYKYTSNILNMQVSYEMGLGENLSIMPFIGYQQLWGDEASFEELQNTFGTREATAEILTGGMIAKTKIFGKNFRISGEYSQVSTGDFNGLDGIEDGQLDQAVESAGIVYFNQAGLATGNPVGDAYKFTDAAFKGLAGKGDSTYTLLGLDGMFHIEAALDIKENVTVSLFYNAQLSRKVNDLLITDEQKAEMAQVFDDELGYLTNGEATVMNIPIGFDTALGQVPTAELVAEAVAEGLDSVNQFGTEWTDSTSYGIALEYRF